VTKLPYVTSPGRFVTTLVTDLGIFEKHGGSFALTGLFLDEGMSEAAAVERVRAECEWSFDVADKLHVEPAPAHEELVRLRLFDPRNDFLNGRS
jgi:acyl CoA:acetate/3-ketoacid CoA transferase beta subunit